MYPVTYDICSHWSANAELGMLLAIATGGNALGGVTSLIFAGIECKYLSWQYIFYIASAAAAVFLLVWFLFYSSEPTESRWVSEEEKFYILTKRTRTEKKKIPIPYKDIFMSVPVWMCCISSGAGGFVGALPSFFPAYFKEVHNMQVQTNGFFSALPSLAMLAGLWLSGPLSDKKYGFKSHEPVIKFFNTAAFTLASLGLLGLTFVTQASPRYLIIFLMFIIYFGLALFTGGFYKSPLYMAPQFSSFIGSMHMAVNFGVSITEPYFVSAMTPNGTAGEWNSVFYTAMGLTIIATLTFAIFGKGELQPWAKEFQLSFQTPSTVSIVRMELNLDTVMPGV